MGDPESAALFAHEIEDENAIRCEANGLTPGMLAADPASTGKERPRSLYGT